MGLTLSTKFEKVLVALIVAFIIGWMFGWYGGFMDAFRKAQNGTLIQMKKGVPAWEWDFTGDFSDSGVGCVDDCLEPMDSKN